MKDVTVKELIERLQELPEDLPVFTSTDDEGNGYRRVYLDWVGVEGYELEDGVIVVGIPELTPELEDKGYTEEDVRPNECVIIG